MDKYNLTEEQILNYILINRTEDFPMEQTLEDFYRKVREWWDNYAEYYK